MVTKFITALYYFSLFCTCPSNKHCPSDRCAYAANVVGKDIDIFALGAVSLNYIYTSNCKQNLLLLLLLLLLCHHSYVKTLICIVTIIIIIFLSLLI
jgi:hypothetical protein